MTLPYLPQFATGDYPAGANPWSGQPQRVLPGVLYWTPGVPVAAEEANYVVGAAVDYARSVLANCGDKWSAAVTATTIAGAGNALGGGASYDAVSGLWYLPFIVSGATLMSASPDDGKTWVYPGFSLAGKVAKASAAFNAKATICTSNGAGGLSLYQVDGTGWSSPLSVTPSATNVDTPAMLYAQHASCYLVFEGLSTGNSVGLFASSDGTTDIHNYTAALNSAGWNAGTNHAGSIFIAQAPPGGAAGPGMTVIAYGGNTPGTDTARIGTLTGASSAALTFTDRTSGAGLAGLTITGLAYSATDGLWGITTSDGAGSYQMFVSADSVTWAPAYNFSGYGAPASLASAGNCWAVSVPFVQYGVTYSRILWSNNVSNAVNGGSPTWTWSRSPVPTSGVWNLYPSPSGGQLVALTNTGSQATFAERLTV